MQDWIADYIARQQAALATVTPAQLAPLIETLADAHRRDAQIFAIGNGGSAANASHFAVDLGKGSSDAVGRRFRVLSLTDNLAWITALGNDARPGDVLLTASVSGNSPNLVKCFEGAKAKGLKTIALVGAKRGKLAGLADQVIVIGDTHYGRVEDVQMNILHLLCYAFWENPQWVQ